MAKLTTEENSYVDFLKFKLLPIQQHHLKLA
jgi:hypothetical protein